MSAVLAKVLLDEPPRISDLRPEVPPALDALITQMLAKDPSMRPATAAEIVAALAALTPDELARAAPPERLRASAHRGSRPASSG